MQLHVRCLRNGTTNSFNYFFLLYYRELYNEPNTNGFSANATLYGHIASIIGPALHKAVPNSSFVGPASGNTGFASGWLQEIFETGILKHFDRLTLHPYRSDSPEMASNDLKQVQDLVAEYAPFEKTNMPIVNGEWGYGATTLGSYTKQAEMLARVLLITTSTLNQPSIWYQVCDPDGGDGQEGIMNCTGTMGNRTFSPLPAFYAAQTMHKVFRNDGKQPSEPIDELLGMRFVRRIPVFQNGVDTSDDWVLLYRASGDDRAIVLVAWTSADFGHVVRLPAVYEDGECWTVTSMLGKTMSNICHDPRGLHVNVTSAPIYLTRIIKPKKINKTNATSGTSFISKRACSDSITSKLPYCDTTLSIEQRVSDLISRLSSTEKLSLMETGQKPIPRLKIPGYDWGNECLHGVKTNLGPKKGASIFPQPIAFGATFDESLIYSVAEAISNESKALSNLLGVTSLQDCWSPNINIFRDPRWGRGSETYGEDTTLTSKITQAYVTGIQGTSSRSGNVKIISVCKHFMGYSLEEANGESRFWFDAIINQQDLSATYLPAWEACVNAGARGIMCSYNKMNGIPMCANKELLTMLRTNLSYTGHVVSDCGAVNNIRETQLYHNDTPIQGAADAINAGTDMNCGNGYDVLNESISKDLVSWDIVDQALTRTLKGRFELFQFDPVANDPWSNISSSEIGSETNFELARQVARESIVLLKNVNQRLPLSKTSASSIGIVGNSANDTILLLGNYHGDPSQSVVTPLAAFESVLGTENVNFDRGVWVTGEGSWDFTAAVQVAKKSEVVVVFVGGSTKGSFDGITHYDTTNKEGMDRSVIGLPGLQLDLLKALASQSDTPIVVVLINGSPLAIEWLVNNDRIEAIVEAWYPGMNGGNAITDVIFGDYAPAGRLPVTFYHANYTSQIEETNMNMREFPGRTHAFLQVPVLFKFGFGLSYTQWSYSKQISYNVQTSVASLIVTNIGAVLSDHSILLFSRYRIETKDATAMKKTHGILPQQKLIDYHKIRAIKPGNSVNVTFNLDEAFTLTNLLGKKGIVKGNWELFIGSDRLSTTVIHL